MKKIISFTLLMSFLILNACSDSATKSSSVKPETNSKTPDAIESGTPPLLP